MCVQRLVYKGVEKIQITFLSKSSREWKRAVKGALSKGDPANYNYLNTTTTT